MTDRTSTIRRLPFKMPGATVVLGIVCVVAAMFAYRPVARWLHRPRVAPAASAAEALATLVPGSRTALRLHPGAAERLGIKTAEAKPGSLPQPLVLSGTLALDPARLQIVRSRFAGEITDLGKRSDGAGPLQFGDAVTKGQVLAILWSRELGETKSELIAALVQLGLHETTRARLESLYRDGTIAEREYREADERVRQDRNTVERLRRTLATWRISNDEIQAVEAEARQLSEQGQSTDQESADRWARAEIRAGIDGVILEQNVALGDNVSTDDVLFRIGDLTRLRVIASAYEEDLPKLDALPADKRAWRISTPAAPSAAPQTGAIEQISRIIDPRQHTAPVMGWVDNAGGGLRAGQFVDATIELPPPGEEIVVPAAAVIELGGESVVFVERQQGTEFERRAVDISRQVGQQICLLAKSTDGDAEGSDLRAGEWIAVSGAVELQQALVELLAETATAAPRGEGSP